MKISAYDNNSTSSNNFRGGKVVFIGHPEYAKLVIKNYMLYTYKQTFDHLRYRHNEISLGELQMLPMPLDLKERTCDAEGDASEGMHM